MNSIQDINNLLQNEDINKRIEAINMFKLFPENERIELFHKIFQAQKHKKN